MRNSASLREEILKSIKNVDKEYHRLLKNSDEYSIDRHDNPFFKRHCIYLVTIYDVSIEMAFYVGQNIHTGEICSITENLQNMNSVAEKEDLNIGHDNVLDYVALVIKLTRAYYKHVYVISGFDDIPYRGYIPDEVEAERERARHYLANKLHPPKVLPGNGNTKVELFLLEAHILQRRVYTISENGFITVACETVLDEVGFGY